jgi:Rab5 GDP/GTP exchange factor
MSAATPPPVLDPWHKDFSPSSTPVLHDERSEDKLSPNEEAAQLVPVLDPALQSEILKEFDPLADQALKDASEAWQGSEGHPPPPPSPSPPRTSSPPPPPPPIKDPLPAPTPSSSSSFSLAAFARTFSIPSLPRSRPLSLDAAKPVPSPNTLSSFAAQQSEPSQPLELKGAPPSGRNSPAGSGTASPRPDSQDDKAKDPLFDFQKFLDQMKLKAAEPVAKYLRS